MKKEVLSGIKETVETIVIALLLAFVIRTFVVETFWIPSGSMKPNLQVGDRIMAYKFLYNLNWVKRGDIIVFKYPLNPKKDFVKRAIGLPGDVVRFPLVLCLCWEIIVIPVMIAAFGDLFQRKIL